MDIAFVVATNDDGILNRNLLRSPLFRVGGHDLHVERNPPSAAIAYNRGLDATKAGIVVFVHHDVYLPEGWDRRLRAQVEAVGAADPDWALIGAYGVDAAGIGFGPVWSTSISKIVGRVSFDPTPVQSYDEFLIVMRRAAGIRFDEALPGFHLYGVDIVQTALAAGRGACVAALPAIHNDRFHETLGADFAACYHFLRRKWRGRLPLRSPIVKITWHGLDLERDRWRQRRSRDFRKAMALPVETPPERYAAICGWSRID